ncbi:hypothetical protein [Spirosoma foliorum]|uniref:Uncharacterized protein n=1 Tax=Spirosoma foliorum TaxID=2710596 RepID=A0A7G5H0G9_9BACT|nr:hypothetical protein [Spirosoma foliorum]QMW04611.1 hypothetical protein H3H32_06675 [Spirosoma foliorum]
MGHVILFGELTPDTSMVTTCTNLAFQYGSTSLWLTGHELRWLAQRVSQYSLRDLVYHNPYQEQIQFEMPRTNLKFSCLLGDLVSLNQLLRKAVTGLYWRTLLTKSMN